MHSFYIVAGLLFVSWLCVCVLVSRLHRFGVAQLFYTAIVFKQLHVRECSLELRVCIGFQSLVAAVSDVSESRLRCEADISFLVSILLLYV